MYIVSISSLWEIRNKGHLGYLESKEREINLHKMVRTPCCEKMGMKKGPWTPEEDHILVSYIQHYGHQNWRALPKQAGLMRCGKSCRLRWINYLRPDIKRGNFTKEEEETIVKLHQLLGNRWAAIAAKLPGRTDNEIKNFWHTHLKKKLLRSSSTNLSINSNTANYHKHYSNNCNNINGVLSKYPINDLMFNMSNSTASSVSIQSIEISHHDQENPPTKISTVRDDATWNYDYENYTTKKSIDEEMEFWYNLYVKSSGETSRVLVNEDHS